MSNDNYCIRFVELACMENTTQWIVGKEIDLKYEIKRM